MTTVRLVPLTLEHAPALLATLADPAVLRFTRTPDPLPDGWLEAWLPQFDGARRRAWAILEGEEFVGYAVTGVVDRVGLEVELGYAVSPWARRRGVATQALRLLTEWAFESGMRRVTALAAS